MKAIRILFVMAVLSVLMSGCSGVQGTTNDGKEIIQVAVSAEVNPPFLRNDENNEPTGYDIEYLKAVDERLPQ